MSGIQQRATARSQPWENSLDVDPIACPVLENWEVFLQPRNGQPFPAAISVAAEYGRDGQLVQLFWSIRDLSDRQQAERKIQEQAALIDITSDAIYVRDLEYRIIFWNRGAESIYGWTTEEAMGKTCRQLLSPESLPPLNEALAIAISQGQWQGELRKVTKSGREMIVQSRLTLVLDETGKPKSILAVDTNITEKKQLEAQFYQSQRLESLGTLASGLAHDLNNILTPILTSTQLLQQKFKQADDKTQQLLEFQQKYTQRGAKLVKQMLWTRSEFTPSIPKRFKLSSSI